MIVKLLLNGHKGLVNHLYWSAMSKNAEVAQDKWISLANHIHDKHDSHGQIYFKSFHERLRRKYGLSIVSFMLIV